MAPGIAAPHDAVMQRFAVAPDGGVGSPDRERPRRAAAGEVLSGRAFWAAFALGWSALVLLIGTSVRGEYASLADAAFAAVANTLPLAFASLPLAIWRRHLMSPEWSLAQFAGLHIVLGLAYSLAAALLAMAVERALGLPRLGSGVMSVTAILIYRVAQGLFVYALVAGFLMWTESVVRVFESRTAAAREAELRARAEVRALHARFNPHFVFNTLHSLLLLVRAEPETAERAIEDVAALIRYASVLQRREVEQVALETEVAITQRYLALETLRLAERIRIRWDIEEGVGRFGIPAFALQTLIENAVRHGIAPKPEGGSIRVAAGTHGTTLEIEVEDDGAGADPVSVEADGGGGLSMLARRLQLLHGDAASLEYETQRGRGFRVRLRMPAHTVDMGDARESIDRILGSMRARDDVEHASAGVHPQTDA